MTAFRGWFSLNGSELTNSSRVVAHIGAEVPTQDLGILTGIPAQTLLIESPPGSGLYLPGDTPSLGGGYYDTAGFVESEDEGLYLVIPPGADECSVVPAVGHPGLFELPDTAVMVKPGLYSPPDGSRRWGRGMLLIGDMCWQDTAPCGNCSRTLGYDDSWSGLKEFLDDTIYRVELAPWHMTRRPESAEFLGIWVTNIDGLGPVPISRPITEMVGNGAVAGPNRDTSRSVTFEALLIGCTHAGVNFGLNWLNTRLRETSTNRDGVLRYLASHPEDTAATTDTLLRETYGVVLTKSATVTEEIQGGGEEHRQANMYRVSWELTVTAPYVYLTPIELSAVWDTIEAQPINWVHAADCPLPPNCDPMPVMFSATCVPEEIEVVISPPPVCGGCLPVCGIEKYSYRVPTMDFAIEGRETAVNLTIANTGSEPLTIQSYWRVCGTDIRCESGLFPLQVNGLPVNATLYVNSITGEYWTTDRYGKKYQPRGIVATPNGAPWKPIVIDRTTCYEFVVNAPPDTDFDVSMQLVDREP